MKLTFSFSKRLGLAVVLIINFVFFPVPAKADTLSGLIGHWKFDEGSGNAASDSSSGGHTATLVNAPAWAQGKLGSSIQYDGANDYIIVGDTPFDLERTDSFTISMWVKMPPLPAGGQNLLMSKADSSPAYRGMFFSAQPSSTFATKIELINDWETGNRMILGSTRRVDDNNWHHVVVTYNGTSNSSGVNFYTDGILSKGSNSVISDTLTASILNNRNLQIGGSLANSEFYTGQIDDVRIYERELSAEDIQSLFTGFVEPIPPAPPVHTTLIGHWKFDEGAGATASDSSFGAHTASLVNAPVWTTGKLGSSLQFDGANDYVVTADAPFDFESTDSFTLSMWVKMPPIPAGEQNLLLSKGDSSPGFRGLFLYAESNNSFGTKIELVNNWATGNRIVIGSARRVDDNNWHHVVVTYNGNSNTTGINFYTDGASSKGANSTISNTLAGTILTDRNLEIGGSSANSEFYAGQIDDVRIYEGVLTAGDVQSLFSGGGAGSPTTPPPALPIETGLIGHWGFDEGFGATATDSASPGHMAALINGPAWTGGKLGSALQYDGINDYVAIADSPFDFERTSAFTVSMWVKMPPIPAGRPNLLMSKAGPGPAYRGWFLYAEPNSVRGTKIEIISNWATSDRIIIGSNVRVDDNNWHHIVFTYNGSSSTSGINFYTDGQWSKNEASTLSNSLSGSILNNQNLEIGGSSANLQFYSGQIDDVQIYNWAVTPQNALALFNAGGTSVPPVTPPSGPTTRYFQLPSTWTTKIGSSLAARQSVFANPMPGSADLIDDLLSHLSVFDISRGMWTSVHCTATNSDPMITVSGSGAFAESLGWNRLRIPTLCNPPGSSDGHVVIINSDDPNWLWEFFGAQELVQGTWSARSVHRWSRTTAVTGTADGGARGTEQLYTPGSGSSTSCAASAALAQGTILKSELDAGVVPHALRWSFWAENGNPHEKHYPCRVPWTSEGPAPASRLYAPQTGERMVLDPSINVDVLPVGAHMKTILKAAQEYGYIPVDTSDQTVTSLHAEKTDWTGYDFSTAGIPNFADWFHGNSRWLPCVESFPGECADPPPNTDPGYYPLSSGERQTWSPIEADGAVHTGYTTVQNESSTATDALAIMALRQNGILVSEAVIPGDEPITEGRVYAEVNSRVNTGVAITNSNDRPLTISFFFTDNEGNDFGAGTTTMAANSQISTFLSEHPFLSGTIAGTFTWRSSLPVAAIAVRGFTNERGDFLMTPLPVSELAPVVGGLAFPHFADGAGWSTQVVLVNSTDDTLSGSIQFHGDAASTSPAAPLEVSIGGQTGASFSYSIPPRSSQYLQTSGNGATIQMGSLRVVPESGWGPTGVAILKFRTTEGITTSESGVAAMAPDRTFRLYMESDGSQLQSGVAISNALPSEVRVGLDLSTLDGAMVASASLILPANGHFAQFVHEIPGFESIPYNFRGVLQVAADPSSIAVVGLRIRGNERQETILSTMPAVIQPASGAERVLHFANGGGYTTQFVFLGAAVPTALPE